MRLRAVAVALLVAWPLAWQREASADGALESVASRAAKGLGAMPPSAIVVSAPLASDVAAPRGEELAEKIAQLVAGRVGAAAHAYARPVPLAQARAAASKATSLVFVQPEIAKGALRVTVDVYAVVSNVWDRARDPAPAPRDHSFADAPLDAEVRAYLAAIPLEHATVRRAKHEEGDVLALACGDLDGDGGLELALVSRARVAVGHVVQGVLVPAKVAPWASLAARAPIPMREALGGASIVSDGDRALLLAGTTDRTAVALDAQLAVHATLRGLPIADDEEACTRVSAETGELEGDAMGCTSPAMRFLAPAARYDAMAGCDVVRPDGSVRAAAVAREPSGKLDVRLGDVTRTLDAVGAQIAVGDLDQDGVPEIAASAADGDDAITVWSWDGVSDPRERLKLPAPGGVRALAMCPPEERGVPALVAVVGDEVWIVR